MTSNPIIIFVPKTKVSIIKKEFQDKIFVYGKVIIKYNVKKIIWILSKLNELDNNGYPFTLETLTNTPKIKRKKLEIDK